MDGVIAEGEGDVVIACRWGIFEIERVQDCKLHK